MTAQGFEGPRSPHPNNRDSVIILSFAVDFNLLKEQEKRYPWPHLGRCPACKGPRLWGHGYVLRYFDGHLEAMWLKRYRCPECGAVHTARPHTHYRRFWAPITTIFETLFTKAVTGKWCKGVSMQRQRYWWNGFQKQAARGGMSQDALLCTLMRLLFKGIILSTHSVVYCEITLFRTRTYPSLLVTAPVGYG